MIHYFTLQAFEEQILSFQFVKVVGIDHEYSIIEDVAEGWANDEKFAAMFVRPGAGKQGINASGYGLFDDERFCIQSDHRGIHFGYNQYLNNAVVSL